MMDSGKISVTCFFLLLHLCQLFSFPCSVLIRHITDLHVRNSSKINTVCRTRDNHYSIKIRCHFGPSCRMMLLELVPMLFGL